MQTARFKQEILTYLESMRIKDGPYGVYRYADCQTHPVLYASLYGALARHLLGDIAGLAPARKKEWVAYIQSFQADDGFFKDPLIAHPGSWYVPPHMDWCGWWHLSCHVIIALTALDAVVAREFTVLNDFYDDRKLKQWLDARDPDRMAFVGNEVLNLGQLLQYARDFHNRQPAQRAMDMVFEWLDKHQDAATGMWGKSFETPQERNDAYQGAYHFYLLYDYDHRPIHYPERIIDFMLSMQTKQGGFGITDNTSGCEDIDALDPLARLYFHTSYRQADIERSLQRAMGWVLQNRTPDGGFTFIKDKEMFYGSRYMYSGVREGCTFATWWRMLSIAIMSQVVKEHELSAIPWQFLRCPGYQVWTAPWS